MVKENRLNGTKSTLEAEKSVFEKKCYEAYKLRWMLAHGETLKELLHTIGDIAAESVEENTMSVATDGDSARALMDGAHDTFIADTGFCGSLWVCLDEFLQAEFQDPGYMMSLIELMDNHEEMWRFYREHYIPEKQEYYVTMKVEGRFIARVLAETIKEAKKLAISEYENTDFGKLEDIDGDCVAVEDAHGDFLWETGDPDPEE